jgi:hypothetical protein
MHADESAHDFKMAEFFGTNIKQKIAACQIIDAVPTLDGVSHCGCQFTIGSSKLL